MSFLSTQPYKGTRDFYPEDMRLRNWMFGKVRQVVRGYGFGEYDGPVLEPFELYAAKTGEEIVNQQLYSLIDRGERKLAIRPEMTPTLARMVAARVFELPKPIRMFSIPNLLRYERPQRGRLREHWQLNVDVLGGDPLLADVEVLSVAVNIVGAFGGAEHVVIRVNNRRLMDYLFQKVMELAPEGALKLSKLIDAKDKIGEEAFDKGITELGLDEARKAKLRAFFSSSLEVIVHDFPCEGSRELQALFSVLHDIGLEKRVVFDPTIMRGMDYYTGTVFEVFDTSPENRRAMFGGGRYDNLVGLFGKHQLSGVGFGMGDVTLQNFLEVHKLIPQTGSDVDVLVSTPSRALLKVSAEVAASLREAGLRVATTLSFEGFGAQLKAASKLGARFAVLLGEEELKRAEVAVKDLSSGQQSSVPRAGLASHIQNLIGK